MGNWASSDTDRVVHRIKQRKHDPLFYKGVKAAQAGHYTEADLCFQQVLFQNPLFLQFVGLLARVEANVRMTALAEKEAKRAAAPPKSRRVNEKDAAGNINKEEGKRDNARGSDAEDSVFLIAVDQVENAEHNESNPLSGATTTTAAAATHEAFREILESPIPIDQSLEDVAEVMQLQQDVEYVYTLCNTEKASELAMVYAHMNCLSQQVVYHLVTRLREERARARASGRQEDGITVEQVQANGQGSNRAETKGGDGVGGGGGAAMKGDRLVSEDDVDCVLELFEELCFHYLVNSSVNYGTLALRYAARLDRLAPSLSLKPKTAAEMTNAAKEHRQVVRRQKRIYGNVAHLGQMLIDACWRSVERRPDEYVNTVLMKVLPKRTTAPSIDSVDDPLTPPPPLAEEEKAGKEPPPDAAEEKSSSQHLLFSLVKILRRVASRHDGGTFMSYCRTISPQAPIVLALNEVNLPARMVLAKGMRPHLSQMARLQSPGYRDAWHYVKWTLPMTASAKTAFPATCGFMLCRAIPQHYTEAEDGTAVFSKKPIPGRTIGTPESIEAIMEYMEKHKASDDSARLAAVYDALSSSVAETVQQTPNEHMNLLNAQMRNLVLMDETALCMKPVYVMMGRVRRAAGDKEGGRMYAACAVMQTACLRGPNSAERMRIQGMMQEVGLL